VVLLVFWATYIAWRIFVNGNNTPGPKSWVVAVHAADYHGKAEVTEGGERECQTQKILRIIERTDNLAQKNDLEPALCFHSLLLI
jgi:hypothetical protein